MIKLVAIDMVGVLVTEKDVELTKEEEQLERLFGDNINDSDYIIASRKVFDKDSTIIRVTEDIIEKLYFIKDRNIFNKIKSANSNIKIIIATNHVSFIRNFVGESFDVTNLDDLLISAEIHHIKPHKDFYKYILEKYNIEPKELLFLDDNVKNVYSAKEMGINTIKVESNMDVANEIIKYINNNDK